MYQGFTRKVMDVLEANIIPLCHPDDLFHMGIADQGGDWYKDRPTGFCYHVSFIDGGFKVTERRNSILPKLRPKRITVKCVDCEDERVVANQDLFQSIRCKDCQHENRLQQRRDYLERERKKMNISK